MFTRADEVEAQWQIITPVIEQWEDGTGSSVDLYRAGTVGPKDAEDFHQSRWPALAAVVGSGAFAINDQTVIDEIWNERQRGFWTE